ncbi:DUF2520 domain-containing protein [Myroides odoratimimus]|uniref:DUF2520 domain-containing protein n=1 Tax=Myroides odoratimimus CIP 101113 TaxID=883154 RepID=A0AAV3F4R8_9FLAO|nr:MULTISPECIES: Rossmann-like and DUF2520 domain-containing protein [Myroides]APA92800.1 hypothetical protein BK054_11370 [Myroides sp. ZB35]EHO13423.1 hypothetical protein HMPREF9715_01297 [Myroides odoratimimus CIP 101113]MDM1037108.1 DUF2520 domain-containing protein [Myroides odoratimimus]MDM1051260.1 DUF2520 domain-containing protein [Myroides odoratimimus]MDM1085585.1 DUF2520 domain-containing protein [Myroides odoratimimus]
MITISILGSGKVAHHLILNFLEHDNICLQQVYARTPNKVKDLVSHNQIISDINELKPADIFIIAVSDDAIEEVSSTIPLKDAFVVHTSGTMPMNSIATTSRKGVFYMLQTFSIDKEVDFSLIPYCIEASNKQDFELLEKLALSFSERVYKISTDQRQSIHLAAVFVNNFTNHLFKLGEDICKENMVPFDILKPLILETATKVQTLSPREAQTGPAARNDQGTIDRHLEALNDPIKKEIYQLITNSIQNN